MNTEIQSVDLSPHAGAEVSAAPVSLIVRHRKPVAREVIMARAAKAAATKLAKRITKTCPVCGKEWKEKLSHAWRKYCSYHCSASARRRDTEKECAQCGKKFKTTCGTRKNVTCSKACRRLWHGRLMREHGHNPRRYADNANWLKAMRSDEHRKKLSVAGRGKVRTTPKSKRHSPRHTRAIKCFLRSPDNVVYRVRNMTRFVFMNPELFPLETVQWKKQSPSGASSYCLASSGLSHMVKGWRGSWRGWTVVSKVEGRKRRDLLGRNVLAGQ